MRKIHKVLENFALKTHLGVLIIGGSFEKTIMSAGNIWNVPC